MSHNEKPTRAEFAAIASHDPRTCSAGCRDERHGDQAPTEEEREVAALRERLEDYRREVERRDELLAGATHELGIRTAERDGAIAEAAALRRERDVARAEVRAKETENA